MIIDAIIGLFGSLFGFLVEGVAALVVPIVNVCIAGIEAVVGLFVSGFNLGRVERKKKDRKTAGSAVGGFVTMLVLIGAIFWFAVAPRVMNRTVTLVAKDGHSLPFAALIIHTGGEDRHERTDNAGKIEIPRFGTKALTVKDPRYVKKTWEGDEIGPELTVSRTILGSGLDAFADRLLKPAKE